MFKKLLVCVVLVHVCGGTLTGMLVDEGKGLIAFDDYARTPHRSPHKIDPAAETAIKAQLSPKGLQEGKVGSPHRRYPSGTTPPPLDLSAVHKLCADASDDSKLAKPCTVVDKTGSKFDAKIVSICGGHAFRIEIAKTTPMRVIYESKSIKVSGLEVPDAPTKSERDGELANIARLFTKSALSKAASISIYLVNADAEETGYEAHVSYDGNNLAVDLIGQFGYVPKG